ncbi:MAG: MerC domain-containing protein [Ferruginibacter sp.]
MNLKINWDGLGIATSLACAIHCAILPLVLTSLPLFGINIIHNFAFEWSMIFIAFCVGTYSLFHGYKTHHRSLLPVFIFSAGFLFLIAKEIYHDHATILLLPAILLIVSAHYINYRLCNKNKCASPHYKH